MPRCDPSQPHAGEWRLVLPSSSRPRPPCCGRDNNAFLRDAHACGTEHQRTFKPTRGKYALQSPKHGDWPLAHVGGHACTCRGFKDELEWRPSSCDLPAFDARRFCSVLAGRSVLFVGDSTVEQAASVLMATLQMDYWGTGETSCAHSIAVADSDTLVRREYGSRFNRGWTMLEAAQEARSPSIIVASAGAHIYGRDNFSEMLRHVASHRRRLANGSSFVWMTTLPGGCAPRALVSSPSGTHGFWEALGARNAKLWNWPELESFAQLARNFWAKTGRQALVLDTSPLLTRVDAHVGSPRGAEAIAWANASVIAAAARRPFTPRRDCVHWCVPGPLSLVPRLLLNLLETAHSDLEA